jgi:hypothetical protein
MRAIVDYDSSITLNVYVLPVTMPSPPPHCSAEVEARLMSARSTLSGWSVRRGLVLESALWVGRVDAGAVCVMEAVDTTGVVAFAS